MKGYYYDVSVNRAQETTIADLLSRYVVRAALVNPSVVVTLTTRIGNAIKITIDEDGIIDGAQLKQYEE